MRMKADYYRVLDVWELCKKPIDPTFDASPGSDSDPP